MTYNIMDGPGDRLTQLTEVISAIKPDIVAVQEIVDIRGGLALADSLGMVPILAEPSIERADSDHPFATLWIGVFSQLRIDSVHVHRGHGMILHRPALEVVFDIGDGTLISVINVHLISRLVASQADRKVREAEELRNILRGVSGLHCVVGDFNAWMPGDGDQSEGWQVQHPQPYRDAVRGGVLATVLADEYVDAWQESHASGEMAPQTLRDRKGSTVDHILLNPSLAPRLKSCFIGSEGKDIDLASDHYPVVADFEL